MKASLWLLGHVVLPLPMRVIRVAGTTVGGRERMFVPLCIASTRNVAM